MDTKKLVLYAALGMVLFALWSAWQQDYGKKPVATPAQVATTAAQQAVPAQASNLETLPHLQTAPVAAKIAPAQLVMVHTDVLNVAIDTVGGNIVRTSLPKYAVAVKTPDVPIQILSDMPEKFYVAQSGVLGIQNSPLQFTSAKKLYTATSNQPLQVQLSWQGQGFTVLKTFTFTPGKYDISVDYEIKNNSGKVWNGRYYTQIQRKEPKEGGGFFALHTYNGAAVSSPKDRYQKLSYSKMAKEDFAQDIDGGWAAMQQRYFLTAWIPAQHKVHHYYTRANKDSEIYTVGMVTPIGNLASGQEVKVQSKLYVGPENTDNLQTLAPGLNLTIDYGWLWPISMALFWLLAMINKLVGNWGWSIIIITVLIRLAFYKVSDTGFRSMMKMRALAPKMKALKEQYGNDRQKMGQATMELYKREKVNPLSGCLPQLIQIPVLFALYYVLIAAVQLRQSPFIFWIHDLSVRDPYYILPILMGISMFFTQKLMPTSPDPTQAKMMMFLPLLFTVLFAMFPAGLVLYYLVNNVLVLLQQWYVMYKYERKRA